MLSVEISAARSRSPNVVSAIRARVSVPEATYCGPASTKGASSSAASAAVTDTTDALMDTEGCTGTSDAHAAAGENSAMNAARRPPMPLYRQSVAEGKMVTDRVDI